MEEFIFTLNGKVLFPERDLTYAYQQSEMYGSS